MHKVIGSLAVLALLGASATATPSMAQAFSQKPTTGSVDCSLPTNANIPYCVQLRGQGHPNNGNKSGPNQPQGGQGGNATASPTFNGPPSGSWNWSPKYRDQFHQRFKGFNFGSFAAPGFSIGIGIGIPGSYFHNLRPVPSSIYRYYPWFRGYLYFVGRDGQFVIVSPRSHKIVAVI